MSQKAINAEKKQSVVKKFFSMSGSGAIIAFVTIVILLSIASPNFMTGSNLINIVRQTLFVALIGIGMTFIIAMGDIDLSVGSILGITGMVAAALILGGMNIYLAIIITLICGCLAGFINGILITKLHIPPFIATLGMSSILRGIVYVYTQGVPIYGLRFPEFQFLAQGYIGPIPFSIILLAIITAIFYFILYHTKLGRYTISIGSNEDAANLVGINIHKVKITVFTLTGLLCAVAGLLLTSRSEAAVADAGGGLELDAIAATVIGGTSLSGGKANLIGTIIGAILMTTVQNGINLLQISSLWQQIVIGAFILIAVGVDSMSVHKATKKN